MKKALICVLCAMLLAGCSQTLIDPVEEAMAATQLAEEPPIAAAATEGATSGQGPNPSAVAETSPAATETSFVPDATAVATIAEPAHNPGAAAETPPVATEITLVPDATAIATTTEPAHNPGVATEVPNEPISPSPKNASEIPAQTQAPAAAFMPKETYEPIDTSVYSNDKRGWYYIRNSEHLPPRVDYTIDVELFNGRWVGDTSKKELFLTFDEGYEAGYTEQILDTLKETGVKTAFFCTQTYIRDNLEKVKRMKEEGHLVCNHSVTHPSMPDLSDEKAAYQILDTADYLKQAAGFEMDPFFRPPMGEYSERTLAITQSLGYASIFWSFAHMDWDQDKQPGKEAAYKAVINGLHNGAIILLHAVSLSNTQALYDIIETAKDQGYEFKSLYDLPSWPLS